MKNRNYSIKINLARLILYFLIIFFPINASAERSLIKPLQYPVDTIYTKKPYFIWNDIHNSETKNTFKLTLIDKTGENGKPVTFIFSPEIYYQTYYLFKLPLELSGTSYEYIIDMMINSKPVKYKYYNYLQYPISDRFKIDPGKKSDADRLSPENFIKFKYIEKENMLVNGYNILFYGASSTLTLGLGILFHSVIKLGMISTVITYLCYGTSIIGYGAAGYYGYNFLEKKSVMNEIVKLGENTTLKGGLNQKNIKSGVELSF